MTLYYNTINPSETTNLEEGTYEERREKRRQEYNKRYCYHRDETVTDRICMTLGLFLSIVFVIVAVIGISILLDIIFVWYNSVIDDILTFLFGADAYSKYYAICNPNIHPTPSYGANIDTYTNISRNLR